MLKAPILNPEPQTLNHSNGHVVTFAARKSLLLLGHFVLLESGRAACQALKAPKQNVLGLIVGVESPRFEKKGFRV